MTIMFKPQYINDVALIGLGIMRMGVVSYPVSYPYTYTYGKLPE